MKLLDRYVGRRERLSQNPAEEGWATFWQKVNSRSNDEEDTLGHRVVDHILDDSNGGTFARFVAEPEQEKVAAHVLQWLGTPVGSTYLAEFLRSPDGAPIAAQLMLDRDRDRDAERIAEELGKSRAHAERLRARLLAGIAALRGEE